MAGVYVLLEVVVYGHTKDKEYTHLPEMINAAGVNVGDSR